MSEESWVCLNGKCLEEKQAFLPIQDRGFLFGDGVFTTLRVRHGHVEFLQAHLQRLKEHCLQLHIQPPQIAFEWIQALIWHNQAFEGIWRLKILVTGGESVALRLPHRAAGAILLTLKPYQGEPFTPCRLGLFPDPLVRPVSAFKTLAYLDRLCISEYAYCKGYDDAIVCSWEGYLLETAFSNLFWMREACLFIPDATLPHLQGVMLKQLIEHVEAHVQAFKGGLETIPVDAAVYICNSLSQVRPVLEIEQRRFSRQSHQEEKLKKALEWAMQKAGMHTPS